MKLRLADAGGADRHRPAARAVLCPRRRRPRGHRGADPPPRPRDQRAAARATCPLLAHVAGQVGDPQVRHRGTIGGSIAHGDPASDLPGRRAWPSAPPSSSSGPAGERDDPGRRVLPGLPRDGAGARRGADRDPRARRRPARAGRSRSSTAGPRTGPSSAWPRVARRRDRGRRWSTWARSRSGPRRSRRRWPPGPSAAEAAAHAADGLDPPADLNASAEYRRHLAQVLVGRALEEAGAPEPSSRPLGSPRRRSRLDDGRRRSPAPWPRHGYLADEGLATSSSSPWPCTGRCSSRARPGSARPRWPRCSPRWTGGELLRLQCYEGIDVVPGRLRVGLRPPAAAPAGRRGRAAATRRRTVEDELYSRAVPRPPAAAARAIDHADGPAAGAADRRGRPGRRRVRGLPARGPVRLRGDRPRARHVPGRRCRRSSSSPRTGPATSTTP